VREIIRVENDERFFMDSLPIVFLSVASKLSKQFHLDLVEEMGQNRSIFLFRHSSPGSQSSRKMVVVSNEPGNCVKIETFDSNGELKEHAINQNSTPVEISEQVKQFLDETLVNPPKELLESSK
jgi:hypothetical protein